MCLPVRYFRNFEVHLFSVVVIHLYSHNLVKQCQHLTIILSSHTLYHIMKNDYGVYLTCDSIWDSVYI